MNVQVRGKNGFIVDFTNPSSITELIKSLTNNLDDYQIICQSAEKSYYEIFNSFDNAQTFVSTALKIIPKN